MGSDMGKEATRLGLGGRCCWQFESLRGRTLQTGAQQGLALAHCLQNQPWYHFCANSEVFLRTACDCDQGAALASRLRNHACQNDCGLYGLGLGPGRGWCSASQHLLQSQRSRKFGGRALCPDSKVRRCHRTGGPVHAP
jgi:hypothetical protein